MRARARQLPISPVSAGVRLSRDSKNLRENNRTARPTTSRRNSLNRLIPSALIALFLLLAGFFSVYYDHGPKSVWSTQDWDENEKSQVEVTYAYLNHKIEADAFHAYTADERSHLADVRRVLDWTKGIFVLHILILIVSSFFAWRKWTQVRGGERRMEKERLLIGWRRVLLSGGMGGFCSVLLLLLLVMLDFSWFWQGPFHTLLFPQGNWRFPADSALITLFPEPFFKSFATHVLLATAAFSVVTLLAAHRSLRERNRVSRPLQRGGLAPSRRPIRLQ